MPNNRNNKLTSRDVIGYSLLAAPAGALVSGISGSLGKWGLSLFNPSIVSSAGGLATFAGIGAIAAPLLILPKLLIDHFVINKSVFLELNPNLKEFVQDTSDLLLTLGAVTAAAAMLGSPLGVTVLCLMVVPAILYVLNTIVNAVNALQEYEERNGATPIF